MRLPQRFRLVRVRIFLLCLVIAVAPVALGLSPEVAAQSLAPSRGPAALDLDARAAILIEAETGAILYEWHAHDRLPPASLTKMATAMVAAERGDLRQDVVASLSSMVEPTVIGLEPGDRMPLSDALYGMMLNSGNDAALAIAESLGSGSI